MSVLGEKDQRTGVLPDWEHQAGEEGIRWALTARPPASLRRPRCQEHGVIMRHAAGRFSPLLAPQADADVEE